jgi:hypothetical protein
MLAYLAGCNTRLRCISDNCLAVSHAAICSAARDFHKFDPAHMVPLLESKASVEVTLGPLGTSISRRCLHALHHGAADLLGFACSPQGTEGKRRDYTIVATVLHYIGLHPALGRHLVGHKFINEASCSMRFVPQQR